LNHAFFTCPNFLRFTFQDFAIEVFANKTDELDEGDMVKKVKLASGADYGSGDRQ